jgi:hypothetical protein
MKAATSRQFNRRPGQARCIVQVTSQSVKLNGPQGMEPLALTVSEIGQV